MSAPVEILTGRVTALADLAARIPGGVLGLTCARDAEIVDLLASAQAVVRSAQGILAAAAGEAARRSASGGDASLARRHGYRTVRQFVAASADLSMADAVRAVNVGEMIRPRTALSGEDLPAERESIAAAVLAGVLSLQLAEVIDETLTSVQSTLVRDQAADLEQALVEKAVSGTWSVGDFVAYCRRIPNLLDPDGAEPRDARLRASAHVTETRLANGMLRIVAELDPERAAYYLAAIRARTNPHRNTRDDTTVGADTGGTPADTRDRTQPTVAQRRLDAFVSILRDAVKTDNGSQAGVDTTVLVRIELQDLLSGLGTATIDGIGEPISAATARRMAADADLIPQVFDGDSVVLDQGIAKRAFTKAQRYAILGSFIGCAFPKCDISTLMTEIHHIGRWATRHDHAHGTDQRNGIPLCGFHNRLMEQGWNIELDTARTPWFTPPATIDPRQHPIRGGEVTY